MSGNAPARTITFAGLLAAALTLLAGCGITGTVRGSGRTATEQRSVPAFSGVRVSGATDVTISVGGDQSVAVTADDNIVPILRTRVEGDTLVIDATKSYSAKAQKPLVTITMPQLREAGTSGASSITATGVNAPSLTVTASGASTVTASGTAGQVTLDASGASKAQLGNLAARTVEVKASGASNVVVQATDSLTGNASGSARIQYAGSPKVSVQTSGAAKVTAR